MQFKNWLLPLSLFVLTPACGGERSIDEDEEVEQEEKDVDAEESAQMSASTDAGISRF